MTHQSRDHDVLSTPSSVAKQDGSAQKRPRSFYSSSIKTWASKHSEHGGNPDGSGTQSIVGKRDVTRDSSKQAKGDESHSVNGFRGVIDCETGSDKSSTCAEKRASTEGRANCDVIISDSDDDSVDSQRVQSRQKAKKANSKPRSKSEKYCSPNSSPRSKSGKHRSKGRKQKALPPRKKVTSKTTYDNRLSSDHVGLILEIESDDGDAESSVSVTPSSKSLNNNVDVGSCEPSASRSSLGRPSVIEIDSDSCSSVRDCAPSQTDALQNHSVALNVEAKHSNNTTTLPPPTSPQQNPSMGEGSSGFPKIRSASMRKYSNFQGVFQSYCGDDKANTTVSAPGNGNANTSVSASGKGNANTSVSAASHLSNGGAQLSVSGGGYTNGAIGADSLDQEQLLALLKSGTFSLQYIAGVPVLCPINFVATNLALPLGASGLQPNMRTIGSIYSPSLQANTVGYGTERGPVPGSVSTASQAHAVGYGAQRMTLASMDRRSLPGSQSSSFGARNGGQTLPKANVGKTFINKANFDVGNRDKTKLTIISRKRPRCSTDSPSRKAKAKATTVDISVDKDKGLSDRTKTDKDRTDEANKNKLEKATAEKTKKDAERPVAKALMGLAMQLVSKQVISKLIKVTKRTIEKRPEDESILTKLQNRHAELKCQTEAFELKIKECTCGRFNTDSSNILLKHLQHGSSPRVYRCCFCFRVTEMHNVFRQHMARHHNVLGGQRRDKPKAFSCSICPFDTNLRPTLELHSKRCLSLLQTGKNLHPSLGDFDIPISCEERKQRKMGREVSLVANTGSKVDQLGQLLYVNLGVMCDTCGKYFFNSGVLRRHRKIAHKTPEPKSDGTPLKLDGTPLKQTTPSKIPGSRTPSSKNTSTNVSPQTAANAVKCCLCDKLLGGSEMVLHFQLQHHISMNTMAKKNFCYFCDCSLTNFKCFEKHMLSTHNNVFPDTKTLWNKVLTSAKFGERSALIVYDTSGNSNTIDRPWQCLRCEKRFLESSFCYRHAMLLHTTPKVECQLCPKMVATGATYTQHLQECHIRKCCVVIERLSLPYVTTTPRKTKAAQMSCSSERFINFDNIMDVGLKLPENKTSSPEIKSPSVTSCDQDFLIVDETDSGLQPATVCV